MENASKALLITAGVLMGILLLTLFSYLVTQMKNYASKQYSEMSEHEKTEFNQQFLQYEGRNNLSAQEVATLINLAQDVNKNNKFNAKVEIIYERKNLAETSDNQNWLEKNMTLDLKYKCTKVQVNTSSMLVDKVIIE